LLGSYSSCSCSPFTLVKKLNVDVLRWCGWWW
jgi:hypothetical protein